MVELVVFLFGLIIGSFLNVCIARLPYEESIVTPASRCPHCQTPIRWYDNVPVLSYAVLRGRCRTCRAPISLRYPAVEILTAALAVAVYRLGLPPREFALFSAFAAALVVITFIDIDHKIIPDVITLPSILISPAAAFIVGHISVVDSLVGILLGGGVLWLISWLYLVIRKQEGMGFGDVKMLAMIGGFQGWQAVTFTLVVGSLIGTVVGLGAIVLRRGRMDMEIPFGPFLAVASLLYLFDGPALISRYMDLPGLLF